MRNMIYKTNAKERRIKLGNKLGIGYGNANQMLSRLNNYGITKEEFNIISPKQLADMLFIKIPIQFPIAFV